MHEPLRQARIGRPIGRSDTQPLDEQAIELAVALSQAFAHALHQTLDLIFAAQRLIFRGSIHAHQNLGAYTEHPQCAFIGGHVRAWRLREGGSQRLEPAFG